MFSFVNKKSFLNTSFLNEECNLITQIKPKKVKRFSKGLVHKKYVFSLPRDLSHLHTISHPIFNDSFAYSKESLASDCSSVGRVVTSNTRGPRF